MSDQIGRERRRGPDAATDPISPPRLFADAQELPDNHAMPPEPSIDLNLDFEAELLADEPERRPPRLHNAPTIARPEPGRTPERTPVGDEPDAGAGPTVDRVVRPAPAPAGAPIGESPGAAANGGEEPHPRPRGDSKPVVGSNTAFDAVAPAEDDRAAVHEVTAGALSPATTADTQTERGSDRDQSFSLPLPPAAPEVADLALTALSLSLIHI